MNFLCSFRLLTRRNAIHLYIESCHGVDIDNNKCGSSHIIQTSTKQAKIDVISIVLGWNYGVLTWSIAQLLTSRSFPDVCPLPTVLPTRRMLPGNTHRFKCVYLLDREQNTESKPVEVQRIRNPVFVTLFHRTTRRNLFFYLSSIKINFLILSIAICIYSL